MLLERTVVEVRPGVDVSPGAQAPGLGPAARLIRCNQSRWPKSSLASPRPAGLRPCCGAQTIGPKPRASRTTGPRRVTGPNPPKIGAESDRTGAPSARASALTRPLPKAGLIEAGGAIHPRDSHEGLDRRHANNPRLETSGGGSARPQATVHPRPVRRGWIDEGPLRLFTEDQCRRVPGASPPNERSSATDRLCSPTDRRAHA